ncbi:methionine ABC transporter ATP-binding protein [Bacillus sp. MRMR6]|uniref:methionine ABC transporter ATP-binding protein n=1 Tax=Bacillus sp. MRMR6 TaxID=1928617 RepID=UPI0009516174|nr:ATP-binding cassette domain-containing protein [Bacillus sp. MRMR6]OLS39269.1 ABC transporter [Bacillus sp. MRMR6]
MISLQLVSKSFKQNLTAFQAVESASLTIKKGEIHGIIGPSGAGKSTLLRLINLLEFPDQGSVVVNGQTLTTLPNSKLREARQSIGMIFQDFNLVANKTVLQNVSVPLELAGYSKKARLHRVKECLEFVGLVEKSEQYPASLSGGQKQRVAIARALANQPSVLLCDEPTSALDPQTTAGILEVLQTINKELGVTIVIVSHEMEVVKSICHKVTVMDSGKILKTVSIEPQGFVTPRNDPQWFLQQLKGNLNA